MEFRELEYERLKQERAIRSQIVAIDTEIATYKKTKKIEKGALYKKLADLEKELDSGALQPGLFEKTTVYPEGEEKLITSSQVLKCASAKVEGERELNAREKVKDWLRVYVLRGDTLEHLNKSRMGTGCKEYNGDIRDGFVIITDKTRDVISTEKFPLKEIYNEILKENADKKCVICAKESDLLQDNGRCPDCEEQRLADEINFKAAKKSRKPKKDTMAVERTLLTVFPVCADVKEGDTLGCCQCEDELCDMRITAFGNAAECLSSTACSTECPRAIQKEDIEDKSEEALFRKAQEWYKNTPLKQVPTGSGRPIVQQLTVTDLMNHLNCGRDLAARLYDRVIDEKYKPAEEEKKDTDKNVCATQEKDLANCAKVPKGFTIYKLDLENKRILEFSYGKKEFSIPVDYKTKKACYDNFRALTSNNTCLNIDRAGEWPRKIAAHTGESQPILFRGDYRGSQYDHKQIRFIFPGMAGFGKNRKFTNVEQYVAEMERLRKDPNYIEA